MSMKSGPATAATVLVLTFLAGAPAASAQEAGPPSVTVKYADLNLTSEAGARTMLQRIRHAANSACAEVDDDPLFGVWSYRQCVVKSVNDAVARLGNPIVSAMNGADGKFALASSARP